MLKISKDITLPTDVITRKVAFLGQTGSGKTYASMKLAELMLNLRAWMIALDPIGCWHGLRVPARVGGIAFDIPVFGGLHGDLPLDPEAGALIADAICDNKTSAILDVSQMIDAERTRFAYAFATQLFQRMKAEPQPLHLFLEECQDFVPENPDPGETRMLHAFQRIAKQGRNFGMGVSFITQRPQEVSKKAINQASALFAFTMVGSQERKAMKAWMSAEGLSADMIDKTLPALPEGECQLWSPAWLRTSARLRFLPKITADVSSTPKFGDTGADRQMKPLDLPALRSKLESSIERAKADDPKVLHARIAELQRSLATKDKEARAAQASKPMQRIEVPMLSQEEQRLLAANEERLCAVEDEMNNIGERLREARAEFERLKGVATGKLDAYMQAAASSEPTSAPGGETAIKGNNTGVATFEHLRKPRTVVKQANGRAAPVVADGEALVLNKCERALLRVLVQRTGMKTTPAQLSILSGYSITSSGFDRALASLRSMGLIAGPGEALAATGDGIAMIGIEPRYPTGEDLLDMWVEKLPKAERKMLLVVHSDYPDAISKETLSERSGYSMTSSGFDRALAVLRNLQLIDRGEIRASAAFFA